MAAHRRARIAQSCSSHVTSEEGVWRPARFERICKGSDQRVEWRGLDRRTDKKLRMLCSLTHSIGRKQADWTVPTANVLREKMQRVLGLTERPVSCGKTCDIAGSPVARSRLPSAGVFLLIDRA
jgi:hypothetical protein